MVAPLDPLRPSSAAPQIGTPPRSGETGDPFDRHFQRFLDDTPGASVSMAGPSKPGSLLANDALANLDAVSESLRRATAYINSARAYFRDTENPPDAETSVDTRS